MTAIQDRDGIRAALIIERLRAYAMGELELTATEIRRVRRLRLDVLDVFC